MNTRTDLIVGSIGSILIYVINIREHALAIASEERFTPGLYTLDNAVVVGLTERAKRKEAPALAI